MSSEPVVVTDRGAGGPEHVDGTSPAPSRSLAGGGHRHVRGRPVDGGERPGGPRLVRGRQPPARRVLPEVCTQARQSGINRLAVVLDVRTRSFFEQLPTMFTDLTAAGTMPEILFLEAADDVIVRRQESVRRPAPAAGRRPAAGRHHPGAGDPGHAAGRRRPGDRHVLDQHPPADARGSRTRTADAADDPLRVTLVRSASRTASRSTPTWWSTSGSCPTRTGCPSCGRRPA